ncbi:MAG: DUF1553 domain-containing protein [Verrucomicrobiales bacterium]|nr:DUF1553 domain-containing protein [Verrucomicrobiales bacterium]
MKCCRFLFPVFGFLFFSLATADEETVDFGRDIRPVLSAKCFFCHGPDEEHRKAKLRLDVRESAFASSAIVAGSLSQSEAWQRIISHDHDDIMPPPEAKKPLDAAEKQLLKKWIEQGAVWSEHWAFVAPQKVRAPDSDGEPIDAFIQSSLAQEGLQPSPEAARSTLLRRLSFDLTGLPPSLKELSEFRSDESSNAYEKQVDRLLDSPHFGERMALMWLDAARYGDTSVMHADGPRDMWPWRDWVVNAYNSNMPYDQFSIEQIAGDLLSDPSLSMKIATGFNRNHPSSDEGGAIAEELRVSYVADRVKTTANVWLGLSMECAQCHDHKYDPISQKEYYSFYAYFNNTADPGMQTRKGNQMPFVEVVSSREESRLRELDVTIESSKTKAEKARSSAQVKFNRWLKDHTGDADAATDNEMQFKNLKHYFPLDENSGNLLADIQGKKDAVGTTGIRSVAGKNGRGIEFDGATVFPVPGIADYTNKSKFTLSAWVKIDSDFTGAILSKMDKSRNYRGYDLWIEKGRPGVHLVGSWPKDAIKVITDEAIGKGQWQHIAVTYDGSGKASNVKIYINGESASHSVQSSAEALKSTMANTVPFRIGGRKDASFFRGSLDDIKIYDRVLKPNEIRWAMADCIEEALATAGAKRNTVQRRFLTESFFSVNSAEYREARSKHVAALLEREQLIAGKTTTMVMQDNPEAKKRMTYVLDRGAYDAPKKEEEILPGTPAVLPPLPEGAAQNRLTLANWLFSAEHPLTSRVAVNQLWQLFFGSGIVATPGDFGAQGAFPSHPELLDWLAVDFRESGWDLKRMVKKIVMSQTYRQSSFVRPGDLEKDAANRFLARAPRFRLTAEMIRDNALALSGLLVREIGGPGVKPYQPPGLWAEVGLGGNPKFVQDHGGKLFRRSIYTYWKRSAPHPAMVIFDAPNRETCVLKRPATNTPLQALAALNDIQIIEASRHLAGKIINEGGPEPESKVRFGFELATARKPTTGEVDTILQVYDTSLAAYTSDIDKAKALLSAGESKRDETIPDPEHAAWTLVCSMILNLDEVLNRN